VTVGQAGQESQAVSVTLSGENSGIISETLGSGLPGNIALYARTLSLTSGAVIANGTKIDAGPAAGDVTIQADSVDISGGSSISSQTSAKNAGTVKITAKALTLDNGSIITTTLSAGRGGNVQLTAADGTVNLLNGAQINSSTTSSGRAGDITIKAGSLTLTDRAQISSASTGSEATGNAGDITITSASTFVMQNSLVTTEAELASGGQIVITAPEMVRLTNSQISTSVAGSETDTAGGNITIDPQFVILQNSQIIAQANAGSGGTINIVAGVFVADPASLVDASAKSGNSGTVSIQSPVQNLGEQLTPLTQQFSSAAALLAQRCAARVADGKFSTFVVAGREGLPAEPGGFLASPSLTAELLGSSLSGLYPHTPIAAVTGAFPEYDARPIQLAKYGDACR
jgi:large exoprotein involved in heme utilization and adhesion